jgi:hypothetical protein
MSGPPITSQHGPSVPVMSCVTIDILSGRLNPSRAIGGEAAATIPREIASHRSVIGDLARQRGRPKFRGVVSESRDDRTPRTSDPPPIFSIADGTSRGAANGVETAQTLIDKAPLVWPGHDHHWHRLHSDGCWGHEPGPAPAGTVDDSGARILAPRGRADYSDFAGCFLIPRTFRIA